VKMCGFKN